ncbi:MFS transporter [Nonomuraea aurantiaca]|uniref:MFS transporter n=1 Tax=Nonomuraea aurantiaca TaxID=2878562 RepID=UPI001CD93B25|nr:MFS transporter [Nonomuraea aurantiaca]MCA2221602.1 MFS transporter [Nonomuraea aurantiaca]
MRLLLGRAISALATALIPTTLTLAVLRTTGSAEALGVVLACELIPLLLLLPVGGVLADRFRPERVALVADLVRGLSQAAIGIELLMGVGRVLDLAVLSAVAGVAIAFGMPAVPRLVAAVVPGPERLRMNARIGVATSTSTVLAPALSGGVVLVAGPGWAALLTAALFACSALTLGGVRTAKQPDRARSTFAKDLAEGWREVRTRPWFLKSVLGHGVWHFMAGLFLTLGPLTAVKHLGGEASWVLIVQCGTVGLVAGVFLVPRLPVRRPLVVVQVAAALYVLPLAALAVTANVVLIAAAYFVAMFGLGLLSPLWETVVAEEIPEGALGRVRAFDQLISFASRPFGLAVAAPLAGFVGMTGLLLTGAVAVAVANLAAISSVKPPASGSPEERPPAGLRR